MGNGQKDRSATASSIIGGRRDDSTERKKKSNPSSKRTRLTYLDPSMKNTLLLERTTHPLEEIRYQIESQIENIETTIQILD